MGNASVGRPSVGNYAVLPAGAATLRGDDIRTWGGGNGCWIDQIWYYTGGAYGTPANFTFGFYRTDTNALVAQTEGGSWSGKQWRSLHFNLNSGNNNSGGYDSRWLYIWQGYRYVLGSYADDDQDCGINYHYGNIYTRFGSGIAGNLNPMSLNSYGDYYGSPFCYVDYWQPALISWVTDTPVSVGSDFVITGRSFNSDVDDIQVGGLSCPAWNVDSDTQITAEVPSGVSGQNHVYIHTGAGEATSTGHLTIGGGLRFKVGGTLKTANGVYFKTGGQLKTVNGIWMKSGGTIHPSQ